MWTMWCGQHTVKDSLAKDHKVVLEYLVTSVGTMGTTHGSAEQLCSVSWVVISWFLSCLLNVEP